MKNNYLTTAWLVLLLALIFGASLAGVQTALKPLIDANKLAETYKQIPELVPGGSASGEPQSFGDISAYSVVDDSGQPLGWVLPTGGQGFADRIEVLIGLNRDASAVTGLYVLDQKETPGLGNKIVEDAWRSQFAGKQTSPALNLVKSDPAQANDIQAVTGATISSDSIVAIINQSVAKFRSALKKAGE
jgi:Na+-translocating ferredoxin:NAD+ oxidoreductase subunit G